MRWKKTSVGQEGKLAELKTSFGALREELRNQAAVLREQIAALKKQKEETPSAE